MKKKNKLSKKSILMGNKYKIRIYKKIIVMIGEIIYIGYIKIITFKNN